MVLTTNFNEISEIVLRNVRSYLNDFWIGNSFHFENQNALNEEIIEFSLLNKFSQYPFVIDLV